MRILPFVAAAFVAATPVVAQENGTAAPDTNTILERKLFFFGGSLGENYMGDFFDPFAVTYENSLIVGGGYQQFMLEPIEHFKLGAEFGAAARFTAENNSAEFWGGLVGRYDGFMLNDTVRISPSLTFGMSLVTQTTGVEADRANGNGVSGNMVFYLSPEISISLAENPNAEAFWRVHHRSSAWNTIGSGSANATTIGIRYGF